MFDRIMAILIAIALMGMIGILIFLFVLSEDFSLDSGVPGIVIGILVVLFGFGLFSRK